ncbi:GNAT family N-acetyltransferase [Nocardia sp. MW-W600-9]
MTPAQVLAAAFADDPLMSYVWPDPARRRKALPLLWESRLASRQRHGAVDLAHDDDGTVAAVAMWETPGVESALAKRITLLRALGRSLPRALPALRSIDSTRPHEPHLYLATIGTRPDRQGRGFAAELIRRRLDTGTAPAFLVATRASNVPFYERFGFRVTEPVQVAEVELYPMGVQR